MGTQKPLRANGRKRRPMFKFINITNLHTLRKSEIFEYVQRLHDMLRKANARVDAYKEQLRQMKSAKQVITDEPATVNEEVVVEDVKDPEMVPKEKDELIGPVTKPAKVEVDTKAPDESHSEVKDQTGIVDFIKDIKDACETAQNQSSFVYEPTSGLYYDYSSGYYYNAERGLYYDGNTGYYYEYDAKLNNYIFHSQAYAEPEDTRTTIAKIAASSNDFGPTSEPAPATGPKSESKKTTRPTPDEPYRRQRSTERSSERRTRRHGSSDASLTDDHDEDYHRTDSRRRYDRRDVSKNRSKRRDSSPRGKHRRRSRSRSSGRSHRRHRRSAKRKHKSSKSKRRRESSECPSDLEDGELSSKSTGSSAESERTAKSHPSTAPEVGKYEDLACKYPPSLRIVVLETNLPKLRVGELFLITYKGGSLGREGDHDVIVPDINVSKFHLTFKYNKSRGGYECVDLGSRNGTLLNGSRMSNAKQESEPQLIDHGSILTLSQTKLLMHVHEGHTTCRECEPGLTLQKQPADVADSSATQLSHKQELKQIKKRYGLADDKYLIQQSTTPNDRAAQRRAKVGSTNPNEKTEVASLDTNIAASNKGFQMLSKLGWAKGQKLGKNETGILDPIPLVSNTGTKGLGCEAPSTSSTLPPRITAQKNMQLRITQERYNRSEVPDNIFGDDGDIDC